MSMRDSVQRKAEDVVLRSQRLLQNVIRFLQFRLFCREMENNVSSLLKCDICSPRKNAAYCRYMHDVLSKARFRCWTD